MQIRYYVFFLIAVFVGTSAHAQMNGKGSFWERTSVEAGWGLNYPVKPAEEIFHRGYIHPKSFYIGALYDLNNLWGLRISAAYNKFELSGARHIGLYHLKYMGEVTLNFIEAVSRNKHGRWQRDFDFMIHSGFGVSAGKSTQFKGFDKTLTYQLGAMPRYRISKRIHLQLDFIGDLNFRQAYDIDGYRIHHKLGAYLSANIGIAYRLGDI